MTDRTILAISGSLRKESFNTHLVRNLQDLAPEGVTIEIADISQIPLYNQDLEANFPAAVQALKDKIANAHGIIVATPEYNRAMPGVLKNVIDWTSRPYGMSAWKKKPAYVIGATDGAIGTAVAQKDARATLSTVGAYVLGQPEIYIGGFLQKADEAGNITDAKTLELLRAALATFVAFADKLA